MRIYFELFSFICLLSLSVNAVSQDSSFVKDFAGGIELQAYPTGAIAGVTFYKSVSRNGYVHVRFGYNWIRHGDSGFHQDERGHGWGGSLGYDQSVLLGKLNWLVGARCDIWKSDVTWKNNIGLPNEITGKTKVTVIQPTARLAYPVSLGKGYLLPGVSFGSEFNVDTKGEDVGEGLILLLGLTYLWG